MSTRSLKRLRRGLRLLCCAAVLLGGAVSWQAVVAAAGVPEHDLKAQIIVRALLFAEWPPAALTAGQALFLCVADDHPLAEAVARQEGQMINGHRLQVRRGTADPSRQCHVAVVGAGDNSLMGQRRPGLLRVGNALDGLRDGVMLNVQVEQGRVVFDINLKAAREDSVELDTRLLRLARYVQRD